MKIAKGVIRIRKSKKKRQHNGQNKKDKWTNNDQSNITHKTKDRVTRTSLKTGGEPMCSGSVNSNNSNSDSHCVTVKRHEHHLAWIPVCVNKYKFMNK